MRGIRLVEQGEFGTVRGQVKASFVLSLIIIRPSTESDS